MQFMKGNRVRHRGLRFLTGTVVQVIKIPDADEADEKSYFCKVALDNDHFYTDRATEWEQETPSL